MKSAATIASDVTSRRRSAADVTREALAAAVAAQATTRPFLRLLEREALAAAMRVDARIAAGEDLPLAGVPVAVKDNLCTGPDLDRPGDSLGYAGPTTAGSRMLERYVSPFTATSLQRLVAAGAVLIGKTNLDEFAMGSSTENSAFGPSRNPWDPSRVPGGSSGGSAAAVASRVCPIALGSDTGGSIRQPASYCGVVGLKPTYGRVSRLGLIAFASSLDQVGPFGATVHDAALTLDAISGHDPGDATSDPRPCTTAAAELDHAIDGLTLGVARQGLSDANHPAVAAALREAIAAYRAGLGAKIVEVDLPLTDSGIAAYYIIAPAEASSNLARYDGVRYGRRADVSPGDDHLALFCKSRAEGFGPEVKRRIMLGTHVLSSGYHDQYYHRALRVRRLIHDSYLAALGSCHAILMPTAPNPAFRIGEKAADPLAMYLEDVYTVGVNLAGLPAVSVPMGFAADGGKRLPLGLQLIARPFDEATLLRAARMFERATPWHSEHPA